jgi:hypothetical protein
MHRPCLQLTRWSAQSAWNASQLTPARTAQIPSGLLRLNRRRGVPVARTSGAFSASGRLAASWLKSYPHPPDRSWDLQKVENSFSYPCEESDVLPGASVRYPADDRKRHLEPPRQLSTGRPRPQPGRLLAACLHASFASSRTTNLGRHRNPYGWTNPRAEVGAGIVHTPGTAATSPYL